MLELDKVYLGDCLDVMQQIDDKSISAVICDLPYGVTASKFDIPIPLPLLWEQYSRIVKVGGAVILTATQPFASLLVTSNLKMFRYEWIWDKVRPSGFQIAKFRPMQRHEHVLVFCDTTPTWYPIKVPRAQPIRGKVYGKSESSPLKYKDDIVRTYDFRNPQSILPFYKQSDGKYLHPTQKPVALLEYMVQTYSLPGDIVLDNCCGSGSTGVACKNLDRHFILIEKEEKYVDISRHRLGI